MSKKNYYFLASLLFGMLFGANAFALKFENLLDSYLLQNGFRVSEGSCCSNRTSQPDFFKNFIKSNPSIQTVGEVGFNGGHSSVVFLETNRDLMVYSFDIMKHPYVRFGKEFIDEIFPNRHYLIKGNSLESIPLFHENNPDIKFDLIFIDGGHSYQVAYNDIINMKELAHPDTWVIIDDVAWGQVKKAYDTCIKNNIITADKIHKSRTKSWAVCKYIFE